MSYILHTEIRSLREHYGLTMTELAKRCGHSQVYQSFIERGLRRPSEKTLRRIAEALGGVCGKRPRTAEAMPVLPAKASAAMTDRGPFLAGLRAFVNHLADHTCPTGEKGHEPGRWLGGMRECRRCGRAYLPPEGSDPELPSGAYAD